MDIYVASMSWLLYIVLQWTLWCLLSFWIRVLTPFSATWMELRFIILSEVSQKNQHITSLPRGILKKWSKWTYLQNRNRFTDFENKLWLQKGTGWGEGLIGGLGMVYAHYCLWNEWSTGSCCIAQGNRLNILWKPIWEKNLKKNGCVNAYNWITPLYSRNYHNIVNFLYFNKSLKMTSDFC